MAIYNASGVAESDGEVNKILAAGKYPAEIIGAEWLEVKKEDSDYLGATMLKIMVKATDEETGIAVTATDILMMPFPEAMDADGIRKSLAKLKELQIATDTEDMGDDINNELFMHTECVVDLYVKKDDTYGEQNKVRSYMPQ